MATSLISRVTSGSDRRAFLGYPYRLYREDRHWIAPLRLDTKRILNPKKNAFFEHGDIQLFVARDSSRTIVGRIAAIINGMHLKKYNDGVGFFGFFECEDDTEVAKQLIDEASAWLVDHGLKTVRGPANPSLNDTSGLLVDGFHRSPAILMPYNKPYYERLFADCGLERVMTMWSYHLIERDADMERLERGAKLVLARNPMLSVRMIDMSDFENDMQTMLDIFNDAWSDNWGHVPMTDREIRQIAAEMKMIIRPELINFVEDDGVPVGFSASILDLNYTLSTIRNGRLFPTGALKLFFALKLNLIKEIRMPLMGVKKSHQGRGIDALLVADIVKRGLAIGIQGCEMSWVLDDNERLKNFLVGIGGVKENEYALFEKGLN